MRDADTNSFPFFTPRNEDKFKRCNKIIYVKVSILIHNYASVKYGDIHTYIKNAPLRI